MDALVFKDLGLDQDVAGIFTLIQFLLNIQELQGSIIFERSLSIIKGQQVGVLVPFDGVVRVSNHVAVNVRVSSGDGGEVLHGANISRT